MKFKLILLNYFIIFLLLVSCSGGSENETFVESNLENQLPTGHKILQYAGKEPYLPQYYSGSRFTNINEKLDKWQYFDTASPVTHDVHYNNINKIEKILSTNSIGDPNVEASFSYENNYLTQILYKHSYTNGNVYYSFSVIKYNGSKISRIITANYSNLNDYLNDITVNCYIDEFVYDGENVSKVLYGSGKFNKNTGAFLENFTYRIEFTYNTNFLNPYSTFSKEFLVYLSNFYRDQYYDIFSKNAKSSKTIYYQYGPNVPIFDPLVYNYEAESNSNYPKKQTGSNFMYFNYNSY
ncbi:hypothetical protein [Chryseobacterium sp.]|uniref:hypothetical protein n=1 Tax=Chryseobacterium sp. TaxID=1871047 RepID=UPI00289D0484|nr:hypothetical protein [Chryseobacterium sp.]